MNEINKTFAWHFDALECGGCAMCGWAHCSEAETESCTARAIAFFGSYPNALAAYHDAQEEYEKSKGAAAEKPKGLSWDEIQRFSEGPPPRPMSWDEIRASGPRPIPKSLEINKVGRLVPQVSFGFEVWAAAELALGFLSGLNLQDHSKADQRTQLVVVRKLMQALKPTKAGR